MQRKIFYRACSKLVSYEGSIITDEEYAIRETNGFGGYALYKNKGLVLDCYVSAKSGSCLASYANSYQNLVHKDDHNKKAIKNCKINKNLGLTCTQKIKINDEIFTSYNKGYTFPI